MIQSKKKKPQSDEEVVKKLCMVNGVSYEKIAHEGINISSLEIFFSGFPRMVGLSFFPRLCHLTIVGQNIKQIEGLECCPLLCELWVVECHLTKISGLENCLQLEKLYLYDNKITEINNLEMQINLQVLWLNNNCITEIQVLDLPKSALQDHTSTPNPVCLLCNYATHILYHMPGLQYLDTYEVSGTKVKEVAEVLKMKKIYYNMRVRTAQRDLAEIKLSLTEKKKILLPEESIRTINYTLKNLERDLSNVQVGRKKSACTKDDGPPHLVEGLTDRDDQTTGLNLDPNMEQKILNKMDALRERLAVWTKRTDESPCIKRKYLGNIRLEEGCSTDSWFTLCCDLLLSRFSHSDYKAHGITGIKTNRVIRIQNSALRLRFEEKLHALIMGDESGIVAQNYRRRLEYLFFVPDPEKNSEKEEILDIALKQLLISSIEGAIPLSNSLSVIDQPRVEYSLLKAGKGGHRQIIISKVYVGNSMPIQEGEPVDRNRYPTVFSVYQRPHSAKAHSGPECSLRQRQWFMFDNELVLPEYVSVCSAGRDDTSSNDIILDKDVLNMEPVLKPQPQLLNLNDKILLQVAQANVLSQITILNLHGNRLNKLKDISRLMALRHLTISFNDVTPLDDIGHMFYVETEGSNFSLHVYDTVTSFQGLSNLIILDLYGNPLVERLENYRIYVVFHLSSLKALDGVAVEGNECKDAKDMFEGRLTVDMVAEKLGHSNPTDLSYLNLQSCSIRRVDLTPAELFCNLRSVNLDHNNLTSFSGLIYLPNVKVQRTLNMKFHPAETENSSSSDRQILHNKVRSSGYGQQGQSKGNRDAGPIGSLEPLMGSLEVLHLSHNGISNMANLQLSRLTNLKALFLQGNEITQVEGLEGLHQLRELVLDKNWIKTFAENSFIAQTVLLELRLTENRIRELNHLDPPIELRKLFLGTNKGSVIYLFPPLLHTTVYHLTFISIRLYEKSVPSDLFVNC
uniref:Leucine rich repeat containing 9 n=1 Tax=Sphaeramia orbicularis TaxID=375764 RepID=A0A672ZP59_9TELE